MGWESGSEVAVAKVLSCSRRRRQTESLVLENGSFSLLKQSTKSRQKWTLLSPLVLLGRGGCQCRSPPDVPLRDERKWSLVAWCAMFISPLSLINAPYCSHSSTHLPLFNSLLLQLTSCLPILSAFHLVHNDNDTQENSSQLLLLCNTCSLPTGFTTNLWTWTLARDSHPWRWCALHWWKMKSSSMHDERSQILIRSPSFTDYTHTHFVHLSASLPVGHTHFVNLKLVEWHCRVTTDDFNFLDDHYFSLEKFFLQTQASWPISGPKKSQSWSWD